GTFEYRDMSGYFDKLSQAQGFKIVLSHFPENFEKINELYYKQYDFDLQLSGHAHGGQFILPIVGPVFSPGQGVFPKYARGSFGERPMLIVSRGLGNAEFPFRLFNHPEINVITVSPKIK
ncbi:MAG: phosphoesterase, partial [Eubacterium sp.]